MSEELQESKYQRAIRKYKFSKDTALMLNAVAGSGKSTTGVKVSLSLVARKIVPASRQKLVTFSNRSSKDLQRKINKAFKGKKTAPQVSTLHGLMVIIIKQN